MLTACAASPVPKASRASGRGPEAAQWAASSSRSSSQPVDAQHKMHASVTGCNQGSAELQRNKVHAVDIPVVRTATIDGDSLMLLGLTSMSTSGTCRQLYCNMSLGAALCSCAGCWSPMLNRPMQALLSLGAGQSAAAALSCSPLPHTILPKTYAPFVKRGLPPAQWRHNRVIAPCSCRHALQQLPAACGPPQLTSSSSSVHTACTKLAGPHSQLSEPSAPQPRGSFWQHHARFG